MNAPNQFVALSQLDLTMNESSPATEGAPKYNRVDGTFIEKRPPGQPSPRSRIVPCHNGASVMPVIIDKRYAHLDVIAGGLLHPEAEGTCRLVDRSGGRETACPTFAAPWIWRAPSCLGSQSGWPQSPFGFRWRHIQ